MTKYNTSVVSPDMKAQMEFMMNIYHHLMKSDQDAIPHKTTANYRSLNGYIKLMQCATNSRKNKKLNKTRSRHSVGANKVINVTSAQRNNKSSSSSSSVLSRPTLSHLPLSVLFDCENNSVAAYFEKTKRLLRTGCKTVDGALDANRDLPMWAQTVESNNIVKQMLASTDSSRIDKGNVQTLIAVFVNFSITMIDTIGMNASVNKNWWKYSYKIVEQLISDIDVHCHTKNPRTVFTPNGKNGDGMLNKALSIVTQLKKVVPDDKPKARVIQNPIIPLAHPVQQLTYPPPLPDCNAQQYVNYTHPNQNYVNGYNYQAPYQTPPISRPPYCPMQYRTPYQPPFQQYPSQVRVNQPQYYQYLQQPPSSWPNNYQKPPYPMYNAQFSPTQFVANPLPKSEAAKLVEVKEDDEMKWIEAQKGAKKLVNNAVSHNVLATRSTDDSTQSSQESEEGLINNKHSTFKTITERDSGDLLPDDTNRMWNFLAREVDKKVRYKFQKMIREMQAIPKEEFSKEPELYDSTYQNVVKIQLFELIKCQMINKKYENVQEVVRDFRLVFSTFRHISQQSNDMKCNLLMDFMERYFNECLRKYFRGWNLDKYCPGVIDIL